MMQTLLTVASASVLGSLHCVAMCGPLLALAHRGVPTATVGARRWSASANAALWHSLGRLFTYAALGMAAGAVGKAVDVAGRVGNVQRVAAVASGVMLIGWGIWTVFPLARRRAATGGGQFAQRLVQLRGRKPSTQAAMMGVLTGLLPCGWLWAFVAMAAGTASVVGGAGVMAAFWIGTLPAMVGILSLGGGVLATLRAKRPILIAIVLVTMGVFTLWTRWHDAGVKGVTAPSCHSSRGAM
jgi:hypothetical protein